MYKGGLEEMKLDKWDWAWLILDVFMIVFYSYLSVAGIGTSVWNRIMHPMIIGLAGVNIGLILGAKK